MSILKYLEFVASSNSKKINWNNLKNWSLQQSNSFSNMPRLWGLLILNKSNQLLLNLIETDFFLNVRKKSISQSLRRNNNPIEFSSQHDAIIANVAILLLPITIQSFQLNFQFNCCKTFSNEKKPAKK